MLDEEDLDDLAKLLAVEYNDYTWGGDNALSRREIGVVKHAYKAALRAAQMKGWRFERE